MDDKFGYDEMKNIVDHDAIEKQKKQEELNEAYEKWEYNNMRAEAQQERNDALSAFSSKFDAEHSKNQRQQVVSISSMLDGFQDKEYRAKQQQENEALEKERVQAQEGINNRNVDFFDQLHMKFEALQRQHTQIEERAIDPTLIERVKQQAKKALPYIVAGAVTIGAIAGSVSALRQPEPVVEDNHDFKSIEDVIEYRDQQVESGITTHPEHVIDDNQPKGGRGL